MLLKIIQIFHLCNDILLSGYIFIFNKKYDIYYIIYTLLIIFHWICLKNECILSYIEKKLINKEYKLGSEPYKHPFQKLIPSYMFYIFGALKFLNLFIIFNRNSKNKFIFYSCIFIFGYIFHMIFFRKTDKKNSTEISTENNNN
jgi:amino acid permease